MNKGFSKMIRISSRVLSFAGPFTIFFLFWVVLFGLFYIILGNTVGVDADHPEDANPYIRHSWAMGMLFYSWQQAIGDLSPPNEMIWDKNYDLEDLQFNKNQIKTFNKND